MLDPPVRLEVKTQKTSCSPISDMLEGGPGVRHMVEGQVHNGYGRAPDMGRSSVFPKSRTL